ncbi:glycosyl hydrolase [Cryobacterium sp. Hz9]|nr:glycosyl hydrolase [Cryobacterium sp. Hz9]
MPKAPLFRDPIFDGATDPTVIRNEASGQWWMFYTQRRAAVDEPGVAWVHGSRIGVAVSDTGDDWTYRGVLDGLDAVGVVPGTNTHWAPEVIWDGERYRMYLTMIDGIPQEWAGHTRHIVEFHSADLWNWTRVRKLDLSSDRVIDACVERCPDGLWRLWYKDEARSSTTWVATSADLADWQVQGVAISGRAHEGPNVFSLGGWCWMIVDEWRGMAVYRSTDARTWARQGSPDAVLLGEPGTRRTDATFGRQGDVIVDDGLAVLYYFTHPGWDGSELGTGVGAAARVSAIQAVILRLVEDYLACDRNDPTPIRLHPSPKTTLGS